MSLITAKRDTWLKKSPKQSYELSATERVFVPKGSAHFWHSYTKTSGEGHFSVRLASQPDVVWWVWGDHFVISDDYEADPEGEAASASVWQPASPAPTPIVMLEAIGPKKTPHDFGFKTGEHHVIVNDINETATAYRFGGEKLWSIPALARGQYGEKEYKITGSDTPPGLYLAGQIYDDFGRVGATPAYDRTLAAYGWCSVDMVDLEGQESKHGRAGIMWHGGGSALGWPNAWAAKQPLLATLGCVRSANADVRDKVVPLARAGRLFISVYQER